jgi:hypothetical protein
MDCIGGSAETCVSMTEYEHGVAHPLTRRSQPLGVAISTAISNSRNYLPVRRALSFQWHAFRVLIWHASLQSVFTTGQTGDCWPARIQVSRKRHLVIPSQMKIVAITSTLKRPSDHGYQGETEPLGYEAKTRLNFGLGHCGSFYLPASYELSYLLRQVTI